MRLHDLTTNQSLSAKTRKDTGYSTASSQTTAEQKHLRKKAAGKRSMEEVDDEVALEMGTARRGGGKKGSYQRKLMTSSQEREVDGDGLEELENERKRSRNRKDGGRSGDRWVQLYLYTSMPIAERIRLGRALCLIDDVHKRKWSLRSI